MKTFNVRLKQLIETLGFSSARKFDMEIGAVESQTASVTGPKQITPKVDYIQKVKSRFPQVNLDWLISGDGEMFDVSQEEKTKVFEENKKLESEVQNLRSKLDGVLMMASMANQHVNFQPVSNRTPAKKRVIVSQLPLFASSVANSTWLSAL